MARRRTTRYVLVSLAAFILAVILPVSASAAEVDVTAPGQQGWQAAVSTGTSSVSFVDGRGTPPLGTGSAQMSVDPDGNDAAQLRNLNYGGVRLDDLTELSYSTYTHQDGSGGQSPYLILNIDVNGDSTIDDLLFFEPIYQSGVYFPSNPQTALATQTWQTWDALNGGWWSAFGTPGFGPGTGVGSLASYVAAYPNARIINNSANTLGGFRIVTGFGAGAWDSFSGNADNVTIAYDDGTTQSDVTYDFERPSASGGDSVTSGSPTTTTGGTADSTNTMVTTVGASASGTTSILETTTSTVTEPAGYDFFGQQVDITAPAGSAAAPITLTFVLDDSVIVPADLPASEVQVFRNGAVVGDCPLDGSGDAVLPLTVDPCVESKTEDGNGDVTIVVKTSAASSWSFGADTDPPETMITYPADGGAYNDANPVTVTYEADEPSTFACTVNATPVACGNDTSTTGSLDLTLGAGTFTVTVTATDLALNEDASAAVSTFEIDRVDPLISISGGPSGAQQGDDAEFNLNVSDLPGPSSGDLKAKCELIGPSQAHGYQDCSPDADGTAADDGTDATASYTDLDDGGYTLNVKAVDQAGNESPVVTRSFFVDTVDPTVTITSGPASPDDEADVTFVWSDHDAAPSSALTKECKLEKSVGPADVQADNTFGSCGSTKTYTGLSDGTYTFTVRVTDGSGRTASDSETFVIDTVDPGLAITSGPTGPTGSNDPSFDIEVSDADPSSGILSTRCELTGPSQSHSFQVCSPGGTADTADDGVDLEQSYADLADGSYTFRVRVRDKAGNQAIVTRSFFVDTYAPGLALLNIAPAGDTNLNTFSVDVRYSDQSPSSGVTKVECKLVNDQGPVPTDDWTDCFGSITTTGATTTQTNSYTDIADGENTFTVRVTDAAGHVTTSVPHVWSVDTQAPDTVLDSGPVQPWSNDSSPTFEFHGTDPAPSSGGYAFECRLDGGSWQSCSSPKTYTSVADGAHTFEVRAYDNAGNVDPSPAGYEWSIDTVKPTVNLEFPTDGGRYSTYKDENLNADYGCTDSGSGLGTCDGDVPDGDPIDNDTLGAHTFTVTATDLAGNTTVKTVTYHVFTFDGLINDDHPIAYYRMNDAAGSSVMKDFSGNHNDGEYKNDQDSGPEGISGDGDYARAFFGDAGYGYTNGIAAPRRYTLSAFVKFDDTGDQAVLHHGGAGAIWLEDEEFHFRPVDWYTDVELTGGPPAPDHDGLVNPDVWYHVVGTMGGGKAKLFVNAVKMDEEGISKATSGTSTFYVGFGNLGLSRPWLRGSLDEVAYFPSDLSNKHVYEIWLADPPAKGQAQARPNHPVDAPAGGDTTTSPKAQPDGGGEPEEEEEQNLVDEQGAETGGPIEEDGGEDVENTAAGADPSGTWVRDDKSILEITAKANRWVGKAIATKARKSRKGKRNRRARAASTCTLKSGLTVLSLKAKKDAYKGKLLEAVQKKNGKCRARKAKVTATLSEDGNTLTLTKKRGKKTATETLTRSVG